MNDLFFWVFSPTGGGQSFALPFDRLSDHSDSTAPVLRESLRTTSLARLLSCRLVIAAMVEPEADAIKTRCVRCTETISSCSDLYDSFCDCKTCTLKSGKQQNLVFWYC